MRQQERMSGALGMVTAFGVVGSPGLEQVGFRCLATMRCRDDNAFEGGGAALLNLNVQRQKARS